ncbi:hypothetical protein BV898_11244 [Hypsibius exemplaris]|uniref:RDD domain-containing protein n=1 Tax=Hypsibius exemplaris TaxID=2072580 RepID=A0A1W0WHC2_HYPEX|nr:hypothetical protein BV898_11244 [Hypsibius exemplaris]
MNGPINGNQQPPRNESGGGNNNAERPRRPSPPGDDDDGSTPSPHPDGGLHQRRPDTSPGQNMSAQDTPSPTTGVYGAPNQEYFACLQQWLWAYQWHRLCWEQQQRDFRDRMYWQQMAMATTAGLQAGLQPYVAGVHHIQGNGAAGGVGVVAPGIVQQGAPQSGPGHPQIVVNAVGPNNQIDPSWRGFKIAPIWKRVVAEMIDIGILMLVKVLLTYTLFDIFFFLDIKKYQDFIDLDVEITYETAKELLMELAIMELAHRLIACLYEAGFTVRGFQYAGATYGKRFMGLRIVTCEEYILLDSMILVKPAGTPTFVKAISRAFLKNYSWAFFLPLCISALFNRERRAAYDSFNHLMVVEVADPMIRLG